MANPNSPFGFRPVTRAGGSPSSITGYGKTASDAKPGDTCATNALNEGPEVVTHKIPRIDVYQVAEDELTRIEEGYGQVGQDLTFACTSLGVFVSFLLTLLASPMPRDAFLLSSVCLVAGVVCLYTSLKWWRARKGFLLVLAKIRSRKHKPG